MAQDEHRMLFDIRGKRKHVVRVVYAILAILMGASLFLVVGPVNIGELVNGGSTSTENGGEIYEERAERLERKLKAKPQNPDLLIALSQARLRAGEASAERDPTTQTRIFDADSRAQYQKALEAWDAYLKQAGDEPAPNAASGFANASFTLAQNSRSYDE